MSNHENRFPDALEAVRAAAGVPGISAALLVDGRPVFVGAAGHQDLAQTVPLDPGARFYIYSATKTLIASLVLLLAERGQVALDAPLQTYLPEIELSQPVSVRQVLNHTGGIPDYGGLPEYHAAVKAHPNRPWTGAEFFAATLSGGLAFPPGQGWGYSNIGYLLLRRLVERAFDAPLSVALRQHIFTPLGLESPFAPQSLDDARQLTPGYSRFLSPDDRLEDVRERYHPGWVSHGVVISTALYLARALDGLLSGGLLSAASRVAMLQAVDVPVQHPFFRQPGYGLGLMIDQGSRYGVLAGHGGGGPGYAAGALHLPDAGGRRITCAALANSDQGDAGLRAAFELAMLAAEM